MDVDVGLDQCESSLFALSERLASESVAVVSQLELSGVDSNDGANEEFFLTNLGVDHSLQEHAAVFQVVHVDSLVLGVVGQEVVSDE